MGENIGILFIFFILLVFGFVFYMRVLSGQSRIDFEENLQLKAIGTAQKSSFLPELQCSQENVRIENCIDLLKLEFFNDLAAKNQLFYFDMFGFSNISVKQVSPPGPDFPMYATMPQKFNDKLSTFIPTSIYNPKTDTYSLALLIVEVYK